MPRAVLDTNVLVSATIRPSSPPGRVLAALAEGAFEHVTSPQVLEEMREALFAEELRPYQRLTPAEIQDLLTTLERASLLVPGTTRVRVCRDPDDDKFLAAALEGAAEYIVSGDPDLHAVGTHRGTTVLTPTLSSRSSAAGPPERALSPSVKKDDKIYSLLS
jgi:putative PIN family toxin of toxin-antitoxin system